MTEHDDGRITTDTTLHGETIQERIIDPRMCKIQTPSKDGGSESILSNLDDYDFICLPSLIPGGDRAQEIEQGLQAMNNLMAYDRTEWSRITPDIFEKYFLGLKSRFRSFWELFERFRCFGLTQPLSIIITRYGRGECLSLP